MISNIPTLKTKIAACALSASTLLGACTDTDDSLLNDDSQRQTLTSNIPVEELVPHDVTPVAKAIEHNGKKATRTNNNSGEMFIVDGGTSSDCVTAVVITSENDSDELTIAPTISTAADLLDSVSLNDSVHLDVDTGGSTSTTILVSALEEPKIMNEVATNVLDTLHEGCRTFDRDIAPRLDR